MKNKRIPDEVKTKINEVIGTVRRFIITIPEEYKYNTVCEVINQIDQFKTNVNRENLENRVMEQLTDLAKGETPELFDNALIKQQQDIRKAYDDHNDYTRWLEENTELEKKYLKNIRTLEEQKVSDVTEKDLELFIKEEDDRFNKLIHNLWYSYKPPFILRIFSFNKSVKQIIEFNKNLHIREKHKELTRDDREFLFHRSVEDSTLKHMEY